MLKPIRTTSDFKGVKWSKRDGLWMAYIDFRGQRLQIGLYESEERAAKAYDKVALRVLGNRAKLNFGTAPKTSKFHGVYKHSSGKGWISYVNLPGKKEYVGYYQEEIEAAKAYNAALDYLKLERPRNVV